MIKQLLESIALMLTEELSVNNVYIDKLPQNYQNGDVFILELNTSQRRVRGEWWENTINLDIHVFEESRLKAYAVGDLMLDSLELLPFVVDGKPLRGADRYRKYVDGVLHVFVTYNFDLRSATKDQLMRILYHKEGLTDGKKREK